MKKRPFSDRAYGVLRVLGVVLFLVGCVGCARSQAVPMTDQGPQGIVVVTTNVDATAAFDEGGERPLRAQKPKEFIQSPGAHQLVIRADGYLTRRYDLQVRAKEALSLEVDLWPSIEELDEP